MLKLNLSNWSDEPVCSACHVHLPREGKKTCQACADRWANKLAVKKSKGECYGCPKKAIEGQCYCEVCAVKRAESEIDPPAGTCSSCRKNPARGGMKTCAACAKRGVNKQARKIAKGECLRCPTKLSPYAIENGQRYCGACRAKSRVYFSARRETLLIEGKCWRHPDRGVSATDKQRCDECVVTHAVFMKARYDKNKKKGCCVWCGTRKVLPGKVHCKLHEHEVVEQRRRARRLSSISADRRTG